MDNIITNIINITNKYSLPYEIEKKILNNILSPDYHNLIKYDSNIISELSIEYIEQIRIFSNFNENCFQNYCVLLKNTDLVLPVINYMNYDNYIQSLYILERLHDKYNINFQLQ